MNLPPPVPPKSPVPHHQRTSSVSRQPALSPTASISRQQGYHQPLGTDKQQRSERRDTGTVTSPLLSRSNSRSRSRTRSGEEETAVRIGEGKGRRRAVFCDVVVQGLGTDEVDVFSPFFSQLGTPILPLSNAESDTQIRPRPATPGKPPRVDYGAVRRNLTELWLTEQSYLRKIEALNTHFAIPLRQYSKSPSTAVISAFQATHLFINLEELVPLSVDFEQDLRTMAHFIEQTKDILPRGFGEMILNHVDRLHPYRKWLSSHSQSDTIRRDLERSSKSFLQYIERTQLRARDATQQTGGFTEFLAEPFQRISRYRLMLDPIIAHLPPDSPDIEPLQIAVGILSDICSMRVDEATRKAASLWGLMEAVEGFPATMVTYDRQLLTSLDVDEIIPPSPSDSKPTTLRCTLILFNDTLLIVKRPSGSKTGQQLIGMDDQDGLVRMYQSSHLTASQASLLGSPKKIKKGSMGYRGMVDLLSLTAIDQAPHEFLLSLGDNPPSSLPSERWCGRPVRRYVVASTYAEDVRRAEKEVFLNRLNESVVRRWGEQGARGAFRSRRVWEEEDGGTENSLEVYWCVWDRAEWEEKRGGRRTKLAFQLEQHDGAPYLDAGVDGNPSVVAKAVFLEDDQVRFSVKPSSCSSRTGSAETISIERITPAIAELGLTPSLYAIPVSRPTTPGGSRSRPLSGLFSSALEVFSSSTSSSSLKRGHSTTSKTSAATTSSWLSGSGSRGTAPSPYLASASMSGMGSMGGSSVGSRRLGEKKSAPELAGSWGVSGKGASRNEAMGSVSSRMEQEEPRRSGHARSQTALGVTSTTSIHSRPSDASYSSSRHRRSSSLPPPAGHFNSYTSEAEDDGEEELSAARYAPQASKQPHRYRPALSTSTFDDPSFDSTDKLEESALPYADPHAMDDAPEDLDLEPTIFPSSSAPLALITHALSAPPRRRMMGPREPGSAPPAARRAPSPPPASLHQRSKTGPEPTSPGKPFERDTSPQPLPLGFAPTQPLRTQSQSRATPLATQPSRSQLTPSPSPARTSTLPSPASLSEHNASVSSFNATKRPLIASPRATPSKKVASLASAWEQRDGGSPTSSPHPRRPSPSQPLRSMNRIASNSSAAGAPRSGRRVVSNASTIRGNSPPPKPRTAEEMDVFDDMSGVVEPVRKEELREIVMDDDETSLEPMEKLRKHVQTLRAQLALDISGKENDRIVSASPLSRSPHTRNVSLKALTNPSSSFASTFSEARKSSTTVDLPALVRWVDTTNELLASLDASHSAPPPSPSKGPSDVEFDVLEQERDLLAAELGALKEELRLLVDSEATLRQDLAGSREENAKCRAAYSEICEEAGGLSDEFNKQLEAILTAFHHEITSLSTSRPVPSLEMSSALKTAVEGQAHAQQELFMLKAQMREEMREKEQWGRILRARGLIQ